MKIKVQTVLKPDELYALLNVNINDFYKHNFKPFNWVRPYIFIKKDDKKRTFLLCPKGWNRLNPIKGKIMEQQDGSLIILSMFPGILFYILFAVIPLVLAYQLTKYYLFWFFWLTVMGVSLSYQILAFLSIAKKFKEIISLTP